jgi:RNA polymerase sigma-70 factor, ECF subfamily
MVQDRPRAEPTTGRVFESVLLAAQTGDQRALGLIYKTNQPRLLRYLRAAEPRDAEDIASDAWLDACRNLTSFHGDEDAFRGWLFTIARRRLVDHRRRRARRPAEPRAELDDATTTPSAEDDAVAGRLGDEAATRIVSALPAEQAEVVMLRVVADLSVAQVAEIVGKKPGAVRVLQHRALHRLAESLTTDPGTSEDL